MTPRITRSDRLAHPTTRDAILAVAENHGACLHPVQLRRIHTGTGQADQILATAIEDSIFYGADVEATMTDAAERAQKLIED